MDKWTESGLQMDRQTGFQANSGQPGRPVGMWTGGWQQGCCLPPAPASEAELATRLDFQFSAPVLALARRQAAGRLWGVFPAREESAAAVNSLTAVPTACPLKALVQSPLPPAANAQGYPVPSCVCEDLVPAWLPGGSWGAGLPGPHGCSPVPSKARTAECRPAQDPPLDQAQWGRGPGQNPNSPPLHGAPPSHSSPQHPQSQRTLGLKGTRGRRRGTQGNVNQDPSSTPSSAEARAGGGKG